MNTSEETELNVSTESTLANNANNASNVNNSAKNNKNNNTPKNNKNTNTKNNASNGSLNAKIEEIQPLLEAIAQVKQTYKNADESAKESLKQEFEDTKEKIITLQTEINDLVANMTIETNAISFFKDEYPKYMESLEKLNVLKNNSKANSENMGAFASTNNTNKAPESGVTANGNGNVVMNTGSPKNNNVVMNTGSPKNNNSTPKNNNSAPKNNNSAPKNNNSTPKNNTKTNNNASKNVTANAKNNTAKVNNATTGGKRRTRKNRKVNKRK